MAEDSKELKPIEQWLAMNQILQLYQYLLMVAGGLIVLLLVLVFYEMAKAPVVIAIKNGETEYYQGNRQNVPITEKDVEKFVADFLGQLERWNELNPVAIAKSISPLATEGLVEKVKAKLDARKNQDFKGKIVSQDLANLKIVVTNDNVLATFDEVVKINGIALVMPDEVSFNVIKGDRTRFNPLGLYINGMTEHEGSIQ